MRKLSSVILAIVVSQTLSAQEVTYPRTKKVAHNDTYFTTEISDPYHWLEDDRSAETEAWVKAENAVTFKYLEKIPIRNKVKERLTKLWNFQKVGTPFYKNGSYFFYKNDGIQNQSVLYMQKGLTGAAVLLLDPNKLSTDGTTALGGLAVSKNGKYLAYSLAQAGSDWNEIKIMDIATKKVLDDKVEWVKFSGIAWKGNGFFYSRYDAPSADDKLKGKNEFHKIYYHKIGNSQDKDSLVFEDKAHALRNYGAQTSDDEKFLIITGSETTSGNDMRIIDLSSSNTNGVKVVEGFESDYNFVDAIDKKLLFITNAKASRQQLLAIDFSKEVEEGKVNWETVIPESSDLLESVTLSGIKLVANYLKDASNRLVIFDRTGNKESEIALPAIGTVNGVSGTTENTILMYGFTNFTTPTSVYYYDLNIKINKPFFTPKVDFKPEDYETKQVFYTSKDGTKIPMFITYKKGTKFEGNTPCWLYSYGGFNISITPNFSTSKLLFLEAGGIYAVANIRGGGEYGEDWHKAGTKMQKQNVFDDFIAAAEYLIKEKYTNSQKLAIEGRSNGGLLIGACITQRPELYKVALPGVGVLDMLRFHKFTIGWAWVGDYGSSEQSEDMFKYLYKYSPLHNIKKNRYPATLITTGDHDDRVVPAHSFKFAAKLQEHQSAYNPTLIRIDTNAGHGAGKPTSKQIDEQADVLSFTMHNLGLKY